MWYAPIIPLVLVNGADGIGMGWSTSIPCYNPKELCENVLKLIDKEPVKPMTPWFRGWEGKIELDKPGSYKIYGKFSRISETTIEISELPLRRWTTEYKELLEKKMEGNDPMVKV